MKNNYKNNSIAMLNMAIVSFGGRYYIMRLYPDCDYFHENRNDEYAPEDGRCESCYRYDICKQAYIEENEILSETCPLLKITNLKSACYNNCLQCINYQSCKSFIHASRI